MVPEGTTCRNLPACHCQVAHVKGRWHGVLYLDLMLAILCMHVCQATQLTCRAQSLTPHPAAQDEERHG